VCIERWGAPGRPAGPHCRLAGPPGPCAEGGRLAGPHCRLAEPPGPCAEGEGGAVQPGRQPGFSPLDWS
jgi:hypothetical protein